MAALIARLAPLEARLAALEAGPDPAAAEAGRAEAFAVAAGLARLQDAAAETAGQAALFADRLSALEAGLPRPPAAPAAPAEEGELAAIWTLPRVVSLHRE